jgi:hypothetical protein
MSELKPCPFCGHESMLFIHKEEGDPFSWVSCPICGTNGPCPDGDKWNARPIEDGLRAEIASRDEQTGNHLMWMAEQGTIITGLRDELKERDEIIARLKEDAEVLCDIADNFGDDAIAVLKHRALMKELEQ